MPPAFRAAAEALRAGVPTQDGFRGDLAAAQAFLSRRHPGTGGRWPAAARGASSRSAESL
jgi:hypothetical protein